MKNLLYIILFVPLALFGQENYSLSFDGVDDYVDITSSSSYSSNIGTISVSFKLDNTHISQTYDLPLFMIDNGESDPIVIRVGQCLCDAPGASLSFSNDDCGGSSPEVKAYWGNDSSFLYDGNWHNISLVVGEDFHEIYLDGSKLELIYTLGSESVGSFLYGAETELFYFGKRDLDGYSSFFQGYMDNIQLWDRPLNIHEISQYIFETPPLGDEFGFHSGWNFNQGEGEYIPDISTNESLAILQGPFYTITEPNFILGCIDELYIEYNSDAGINDGTCQILYSVAYAEVTQETINLNNTIEEATTSLSSLQQALDTWNTTIDLSAGWNMFGYGCPTSIDVADGLSNHTESIIITKDNAGNVYMPEFGFNGIGDFTPGYGYQIKVSQDILGFSLCDWYVNDIPEDNIVSLQEELILLQDSIETLNTPIYEIGDYTEGGIVFYLDETGHHGLVAALEDLGQFEWGCYGTTDGTEGCLDANATNYDADATVQAIDEYGNLVCTYTSCDDVPYDGCLTDVFYPYAEGFFGAAECSAYGGTPCDNGEEESIASIADGLAIGTGYQNTLDIVAGCSETPIAASEVLAYESGGYSDWYLPSRDELAEMYNTIGNGGLEGNIGGFSSSWYWSSSEYGSYGAWHVDFTNGLAFYNYKIYAYRVRVIRAF